MRTAIYARYSSSNQDNGVSIEQQLETCYKLAGDKPLEFIDRAISGRTMHREQFRRMMAAAEAGEFDKLIVYKWDRFGRNAETHSVVADLEDLGINVSSATEGDDFLARGVGLLVSENYSRALSERMRGAMRIRFRQNHSFMGGQVPFGYRLERRGDLNYLTIDPTEAAIVRKVFDLYLKKSMGARLLVKELDKQGITYRGEKWAYTTLNRMLRNEIFLGIFKYGKNKAHMDRKTGKETRIKQETGIESYQDEKLRIISDALFMEVGRRMAKRSFHKGKLPRDVRAFSNRCYCGECGSVMYTRHTFKKRGEWWYFMACGKRERLGSHACSNKSRPPETELLKMIQDGFMKVLDQRDAIIKRAVELATAKVDTNDQQRTSIESELAKVEKAITRMRDTARNPDADQRIIDGALLMAEGFAAEKAVLVGRLRDLAAGASYDRKVILREVTAAMEEARESFLNVTDVRTLNSAIEHFVGAIVVHSDGSIQPASQDVAGAPARGTSWVEPLRLAFWATIRKLAA